MEAKEVVMYEATFRNGNGVAVSELFENEAVFLKFTHNAGMAKIKTEISLSEQAARELGKLLVKYHDRQSELEKKMQLAELSNKADRLTAEIEELKKENEKLRDQVQPKKLQKKVKSA